MRFWRSFLPNLSIALNVVLLIVLYFDRRNPMMGFTMDAPFLVLVIASAVSSVCVAITLYVLWRKAGKSRKKTEKIENDT